MLVAGTVAFDLVAQIERFPVPDESRRLDGLVERPGGCGGNVAVALARLGHRATLLSAVGPDFHGSAYHDALVALGVDLDHVVVDHDRPTARAIVASDPERRQLILYHEGATPAMGALEPLDAAIGHFAPGELTAYPKLMAACDVVTYDPGQESFYRPPEEVLAPLAHVDHLFLNRHECDVLAAHAGGLDALVEEVRSLIVTDPQGQSVYTADGTTRVPGVTTAAVDTTGAGDAHRAGFLHGLDQGWDLERCCRFGSVVAAFAVETAGAQAGLPTRRQAEERYQQAYRSS